MELKSRVLNLLRKTGLTPAEAKFYLAVHENPSLTIRDLQKIARISLTSAYRAFENLKRLGLLTSSPENWRQQIKAVSLKTLATKVGREQRRLRKVELELKHLGNLMNLSAQSFAEDPVQIFTDQNQIIEQSYKILHRPWRNLHCYGSAERAIEILGEQAERDFVRQRFKKGKVAEIILTEIGPYGQELIEKEKRELRHTKTNLDPENQHFLTYIYDGETTIWHTDKDLGTRAIVINDPALQSMYENMYHIAWGKV